MNEWNNEDLERSVYIFHNTVHDIFMYVNCRGADDAMQQFDLCNFKERKEWKIYLEMGDQPARKINQ